MSLELDNVSELQEAFKIFEIAAKDIGTRKISLTARPKKKPIDEFIKENNESIDILNLIRMNKTLVIR